MTDHVSAGQNPRRRVAIVPHTHWDREWYSPFQTFRLRLVDLLDDLLPALERDPSYAHFMLDGQVAVVDDYVAVRPEAEAAIRRLNAAGRLSIGPWYILMDEFLVSGETIIRDLQLGLERAAALGGAMEVGYLPDMFGHIAQMPQLLRQFGFEHAVVWRGVPSAVNRSGFWWSSPDGSTVRAEYMPAGYGNGAILPDDAKALLGRIRDFEARQGRLLVGPLLWMNGTDHLRPQPWLGRVVDEANALQDDYELRVVPLADHLASAATTDLPEWTGELRSGARANLLMGVASNRVDVKQATARAERAIERLAEPLSALFLPAARWPEALLAEAWLAMIRNSAHDSVCACSVDEVCDAVLHRYAEARQIGEGLAERAVASLAAGVGGDPALPVIVNPSARVRSGLVEFVLSGDPPPEDTQTVSVREGSFVVGDFASSDLAAGVVLELEYRDRILSATVTDPTGRTLVEATRDADGVLIDDDARQRLEEMLATPTPGPIRVSGVRDKTRMVLARVERVPGFGWRRWSPSPREGLPVVAAVDPEPGLANGLVTVTVDPRNGTFSIDGFPGFGRLVDDGDVGDTYNWCPPPNDEVVDEPESVRTSVTEVGPLRGRLSVNAAYRWRGVPVEVATTIELHAGESLVRVSHRFENRARDHRLRAWVPLRVPATMSEAECAFAVVPRGLDAEGGPTEFGLPTFPSRRFVRAGGVTVVHEGLLEYELVDIVDDAAHALALTLLRCTGLLSQGPMATRPLPAGPMVPAEGAQMQGPVEVRYAIHVGDADPYALADDAFLPLLTSKRGAGGGGTLPVEGQGLSVTGAEVSALRRTPAGALELRVFNPTAIATSVTVDGRRGWLVDLRGRPVEPFEGSFPLAPWRIATAVLAD